MGSIYIKNGTGSDIAPANTGAVFESPVAITARSGSTFTVDSADNDWPTGDVSSLGLVAYVPGIASGTTGWANVLSIAAPTGSGPYTYVVTCDRAIPAGWAAQNVYVGPTLTFPSFFGTNVTKLWSTTGGSSLPDLGGGSAPILVNFKSAHTEDRTTAWTLATLNGSTCGAGLIRAEPGAAVAPEIVVTANVSGMTGNVYWVWDGINIRQTNASKTGVGVTVSFGTANTPGFTLRNCCISGFGTNVSSTGNGMVTCENVWSKDPNNTTAVSGVGIGFLLGSYSNRLINCLVSGATGTVGGQGVQITNGTQGAVHILDGVVVAGCANATNGHGFNFAPASTPAVFGYSTLQMVRCVSHGNAADGVRNAAPAANPNAACGFTMTDCQVTSNGGVGINFSGASFNDIAFSKAMASIRNCNLYGNGSVVAGITSAVLENCTALPPGYANPSAYDFRSVSGAGRGFMSGAEWGATAVKSDVGAPGSAAYAASLGGGSGGNAALGLLGGAP